MSTSDKVETAVPVPETLAPPPPRRATRRPSRAWVEVLHRIAVILIVVIFLFPFVWMLLASFKRQVDITAGGNPLNFTPTLDNYRNVFKQYSFLGYFINSLWVAVASTGLSLLLGLPASYAIARYKMRRSGLIILAARVIPGISLLVPWFILFTKVHLVGTYAALILSHMLVGLPLIAWVMIGFFEALPRELEEAAQVDGLSQVQIFVRIVMPLARPGILTAAILAIIFSWNNFMFSLVLANATTRTLPVAIFNFISYASIDWGGLMAASMLITVPIILIAILVQRHVVSGLTAGATKG